MLPSVCLWQVEELHELLQKCEVLCSALPDVVERLVALQGLHHEGKCAGGGEEAGVIKSVQ